MKFNDELSELLFESLNGYPEIHLYYQHINTFKFLVYLHIVSYLSLIYYYVSIFINKYINYYT